MAAAAGRQRARRDHRKAWSSAAFDRVGAPVQAGQRPTACGSRTRFREVRPVAGRRIAAVSTAILTTPADSTRDWLAAGQVLHRVLLHAATRWVFASLYAEPLESPQLREQVRVRPGIGGMPQMLLQFGRATAAATARRPASELFKH